MEFFDFHHHSQQKLGIYNLNLYENATNSWFSAGIHPKDASFEQENELLSWLNNVAIDKNCVAIGECGLDSLVSNFSNVQEYFFEKQISLANDLKKPLIIHCVRKFYEVIGFQKKSKQPMIIHGFNKKESIAKDLLKHNFYLSFGKAVLENLSLQKIVEETPINKLFLESDDAQFPIENLYQKTSEIKKIPIDVLIKQIQENLETIRNG